MQLTEFLPPENIYYDVVASSKKKALELVGKIAADAYNAQHASEDEQATDEVCPTECFSSLFKREKLGCTYLGSGIALPHAKLAVSDTHFSKPIAVFLKLESPINYEAGEHKEVDLVYAVLFPENSCEKYKGCLQAIAHKLNDKSVAKQIRSAQSADEIWQIFDYLDKQDNLSPHN